MSRTGSRAHVLVARVLRLSVIVALSAAMVPLGAPVASAGPGEADTYWVNANDGLDIPSRGSQAEPFATITYAASLADPLDTIMVMPGTYAPVINEQFPINFNGASLVSVAGPATTSIQGNGTSQLLVFTGWTDGDRLQGFTISNGGVASASSAVQVTLTTATSAAAAPRIEDCIFSGNSGGNTGGALYANCQPGTNLVIAGNTFDNNSAIYGGGMTAVTYGNLTVTGNEFTSNAATYGAAAYLYSSMDGTILVDGNTFITNTATNSGGAIQWAAGSLTQMHTVRYNEFSANSAAVGGALYLVAVNVAITTNRVVANSGGLGGQAGFAYLENADVLAENNYLAQNTSGNLGSVWVVDPNSSLTEINDTLAGNYGSSYVTYAEAAGTLAVVNCVYWNETTPVEMSHADNLAYTCSSDDLATLISGGNTVGLGMVYADPLLDGASLPALLDTSPCIDAGSPFDWAGFDYFGTTRPQGPAPDIGAYEKPQVAPLSVYRFFRPSTGTHFYTADEGEKNNVIATLGGIYAFEGVSYTLNQWNNATPLYRFFRPSTGTHFYTADSAEMMNIRNTLGGVYAFEGVSYNVSSDDGGGAKPAVYRFFKRSSGTHFYTADPAERDNVIANLSAVYQYEGPAFWVGQ